MRDITLEETIYMMFSTRAFATGIPTTLAGTPVVSAYENDSLTQITAGITLGVDHDGVAGLHLLTIVATSANGYESGKDYHLVITTGTVGGVSVVGEVVGEFTIGRSAAAVDLANGTDGLGTIKTDTAAILVDTGTTLDARIPAALVGGRMDSDVGAKTGNMALSAQEKLDVNAEVDTALNTAIPGVPTADSINQRVAAVDDLTQTAGGGDLAAILTDTGTTLDDLVDDLEGRLTAARAGYLDNLSWGAVALAASWTAALATALGNYTAVRAGYLDELGALNIPADVDTLLARLTALRAGYLDNLSAGAAALEATVAALNNLSAAAVNAEVVDVLGTDALPELSQGIPSATPTHRQALMLLYMALRNKLDIDASSKEIHNDAGTVICKKALSDDGSVYSEAEMASGP